MSTRRAIRLVLAGALALTGLAALPSSAAPKGGFKVKGSQLLDGNGKPFVLRGIHVLHATSPTATAKALSDIAKTGANSVRLTVSSTAGGSVKEVATLVDQCKKAKLICMFVDQDTNGYGESGSPTAVTLTQAVDYWRSVKSALVGQEAYTLIDIGQMPYGSTKAAEWTGEAKSAVKAMRAAGFKHTLLVDGPDYGEDQSKTMQSHAAEVLAADPVKNTAFSVLMYGTYNTPSAVKTYIDSYVRNNLCLVIGEFSWSYLPWGAFNAAGGGSADGPDEASIMAYAEQKGVGWNAYSWTGSSPEKAYDDLTVNGDPTAQTPWYSTAVMGPNGIRGTSKTASVYS